MEPVGRLRSRRFAVRRHSYVGQSVIEYVIILSMIAFASLAMLHIVQTPLTTAYNCINNALSNASTPACTTNRGAWNSSTTYNYGDAVTNNGSTYVAIATNTNQSPPNTTYWQLVSSGGGTTLYVANYAGNSITEYPTSANGNVTPTITITGASTGLNESRSVAIDSSGTIYVANMGTPSITEYSSGASGNATPVRTITGASTNLAGPYAVAVNSSGTIFVANGNKAITEYASGANGNVAPTTTISGSNTALSDPEGLTFDSGGTIYVANYTQGTIEEFAAGASGNVAPIRTISGASTGLSLPGGMAIDSSGTLYVANAQNGPAPGDSISEYAPGASGNVAPTRTIYPVSSPHPYAVGLDSSNDLFVGSWGNSVSQYAEGASGAATALTTITGGSTGMNTIDGIAVSSY